MTTPITLPWLPPGEVVAIEGRGEFFVRRHRLDDPDAPTVLLLHGWTASSDLQFFTAYEALAQRYSFVGIDHRGHGRGLRSVDDFSFDDVADDAAAVLQKLGIERVILVGYSMGGPIAMTFARRYREAVAGLVVQATALEWSATWRDRLRWRLLPALGAALRSWASPRFLRRFLDKMLHEHHELAPYVPWIRGESARNDPAAMVSAGRELSRYDAREWSKGLGVPASMVLTTKDRLVKPAKQRALARALKASIVEVPADHLAPWELPDRFAAATVEAIEAVRRRG